MVQDPSDTRQSVLDEALDCQVVIPTHDPERPIRRAVDSVLADSRAGVIVVAHNVDESVLDIPDDPRVLVVALTGAEGRPGAAFDAGLAAASAPWVGIMGSDDWYEAGALQAMVRHGKEDNADGVLTPLAYQDGTRGLIPRTFRNRNLKAAEDRLFYRTAPLGLYRREVLQSPEYAFGDEYPVGSDVAVSTRLWTSGLSISYYPRDPAYVVGADAKERTTLRPRPLAEHGAAWLGIWDEPWVQELSKKDRRALATKILRVHVFGAVEARPTEDRWGESDFEWLADLTHRIVEVAPESLAPFRKSSAQVFDSLLARDLPATLRAMQEDRAASLVSKIISSSPTALLSREAPLRWQAVAKAEEIKAGVAATAARLRQPERVSMMGREGRPRLLILSFSPIKNDARVIRQVNLFKCDYDVITAGFGEAPEGVFEHIELDSALLPTALNGKLITTHLYHRAYWSMAAVKDAWEALRGLKVDCAIADDIEALPIAVRLKPTCGIVADFHEHYPSMHEYHDAWKKRISPYYSWLIRRYAKHADVITTVSFGLQKGYEAQFGFKPHLVVNATPYANLQPGKVAEPIRLVHSGACQRKRNLEVMLDAVQQSSANVSLDMYVTPNDPAYLEELTAKYATEPRIRFNEPVPYEQLVDVLNRYDVGVFILPPATFSYRWALPNKFFDYVQARLGILVGPSPEMAGLVRQVGNGEICQGFTAEDLQIALENLSVDKVEGWKQASQKAAPKLSAEHQSGAWVESVEGLIRDCEARPPGI